MPKSDNLDALPDAARRRTANPSRRAILGAAAVLPLAAVPVAAGAAAGDDTKLLDLCRDLARAAATIRAIEAEGDSLPPFITPASDDQERRLEAAGDVWWALAERICVTPARTPGGLRAKADALGTVMLAMLPLGPTPTLADLEGDGGRLENRLAWSLARDVTGTAP